MSIAPLAGQTSPCEEYNSSRDRLIDLTHTPQGEICKTSFLASKVSKLINEPGVEYVRIGILEFVNQRYYTIISYDSGDNQLNGIIGDLPCPEDCVPPETKKEKLGYFKGFTLLIHKFDVACIKDIFTVHGSNVKYVNIKRAIYDESSTNWPTVAVYAVTTGTQGDQEQINNAAYISINQSRK